MSLEPIWTRLARRDLGVTEIPGRNHNPRIVQMAIEVGAWWRDDEMAWCGVAMGAWILEAGYQPARPAWRALKWLDWGLEIEEPCVGAIAIYDRGHGLGHVNTIIGVDHSGRLLGIGGNQGNRVSVAAFDPLRLLGLRWPTEAALLVNLDPLPVLSFGGASSSREA